MTSKIYNMIPGKRVEDNIIIKRIIECIDSIEYDDWIELALLFCVTFMGPKTVIVSYVMK